MTAKTSDFMTTLQKRLIDERGITESSANKYLQLLFTLNDKTPFKNLAWTKKYEELEKKIDTYAKNTQYIFYNALVSTLSLLADKPTYKPIHKYWSQKVAEGKVERSQADPHEKSEVQQENWTEWEDVLKKKQQLDTDISNFHSLKKLNPSQYDTLLQLVILSLYTDIPPRRNQDYQFMYVVKKLPKDAPTDRNYYDIASKQFIFNKYKTSKTYGQAKVDIPESLQNVLSLYVKHHPLSKTKEKNGFPFLVKFDGTPLNNVNGINRILNKLFGKRVGSSMLRHSYLTSKYGNTIKEMEQDGIDMAHSTAVQSTYIKE